MTNGRSKTDILSETAKAGLRELWIRVVFNREKFDTTNKYTEKGIMCEPDAMELIKEVTGITYFKNKVRFKNDFIEGEPDIFNEKGKFIIDVKTSWSIWTFNNVDEKYALYNYYYQLLGYMWLTGSTRADIMFCLVNTPEDIMMEELRRLAYKYPEIDESDEKAERFIRNYKFDDIPAKLRLKTIPVDFSDDDIELLKERVVAARVYLSTLSL